MKRFFLPIILLAAVLLLAACQSAPAPAAGEAPQAAAPTAAAAPATAAPAAEPVLTVHSGSGDKSYTMDDLKKLPAVEGQAGIKSSTGKITPPALFKGVLITDLVADAGGADSSKGVQITASDGYAMTFSYDQVANSDFITYDPATGDENKVDGKLQTILAYEMDGQPLNTQTDGNLRLMVISEKNNQVVDGHWTVKFVNDLAIKPLVEEWSLVMQGAINDEVDRGSFESCSTKNCHQATWTDGKAQTWSGTPLYLLLGRVDDESKHDTGAFNRALAEQGYQVEVVARDGYSATFDSTKLIDNKNIILAYSVNNNALVDKDFPLKLVGPDLSGKEMVSAVDKIILKLPGGDASAQVPTPASASNPTEAPAAPAPSGNGTALTLTGLVDKEQSWSLETLQKMDVTSENVDHPKKGIMDVKGILLNPLLDMAGVKVDAKTLVITASDGYSAEADLKAIRDCPKAMVAFDTDGSLWMVLPDLQSNFWVKSVVKLELK
jgi:DMSO/TMAO reductase YedYZ molybdopterin-dependent catalytic subunit